MDKRKKIIFWESNRCFGYFKFVINILLVKFVYLD